MNRAPASKSHVAGRGRAQGNQENHKCMRRLLPKGKRRGEVVNSPTGQRGGASAPVCRDLVPPSDELKGETETSPAEEKEAAAVVVLGKKGAVSLLDDLCRPSRSCGKALGTGGGGRMFPKMLHPHFSEKQEDKKVTGLECKVKTKTIDCMGIQCQGGFSQAVLGSQISVAQM